MLLPFSHCKGPKFEIKQTSCLWLGAIEAETGVKSALVVWVWMAMGWAWNGGSLSNPAYAPLQPQLHFAPGVGFTTPSFLD